MTSWVKFVQKHILCYAKFFQGRLSGIMLVFSQTFRPDSVFVFFGENHFCCVMLCISTAHAVTRCLSVCLSRSWLVSK